MTAEELSSLGICLLFLISLIGFPLAWKHDRGEKYRDNTDEIVRQYFNADE